MERLYIDKTNPEKHFTQIFVNRLTGIEIKRRSRFERLFLVFLCFYVLAVAVEVCPFAGLDEAGPVEWVLAIGAFDHLELDLS